MPPIDLSYLKDEETRTTSETGGQKGTKLTQIGALDPVAQIVVGRVAGMGANKYAAFNYLRGYEWSKSYNALMRHANLFWAGEDNDSESGLPHMGHVAWMAQSIISFQLRGLGTDDRPPALLVPDIIARCTQCNHPSFMHDDRQGYAYCSICNLGDGSAGPCY